MSAYAARLPAWSLPRIKFKRPRWPRGDRVLLVLAVMFGLFAVNHLIEALTGGNPGDWTGFGLDAGLSAFEFRLWWRSRDDDGDGPSAT